MIHLNPLARFLRLIPCWRRFVAGFYLNQRRERLRRFRDAVRREKAR